MSIDNPTFVISRSILSGLTLLLSGIFGYWGYSALMSGKGLELSETVIHLCNGVSISTGTVGSVFFLVAAGAIWGAYKLAPKSPKKRG